MENATAYVVLATVVRLSVELNARVFKFVLSNMARPVIETLCDCDGVMLIEFV